MNAGKKIFMAAMLGASAGFIAAVPLILQNLPWSAVISAFLLWVVNGVLVSALSMAVRPAMKGLIISTLVMVPCAVIISWNDPAGLIPLAVTTAILGSLLGLTIDKCR